MLGRRYFKVSVSDFLTLFSARTPDGPFYSVIWGYHLRTRDNEVHPLYFRIQLLRASQVPPSRILLCAGVFATGLSTILASAWPASHPDGIDTVGLARVNPRVGRESSIPQSSREGGGGMVSTLGI